MIADEPLRLADVERRVCDIASEQLGIRRDRISPGDRIVEDLRCDSLDLVELFMEVEQAFGVTLPDDSPNPVFKAVFTRKGFRLADLAELVYLQQGTGKPERDWWRRPKEDPRSTPATLPFTQLDGRWERRTTDGQRLLEPLETAGPVPQYRRRSDGMRCLLIPAASVEIGCDSPDAHHDDEQGPQEAGLHVRGLDDLLRSDAGDGARERPPCWLFPAS
jgi:acyl carrier protein